MKEYLNEGGVHVYCLFLEVVADPTKLFAGKS